MVKVFMGGTVGTYDWRARLVEDAKNSGLTFINPVVSVRGVYEKGQEIIHRKECDLCLYCITPEMRGVFSIAEAVEDSITKSKGSTLFYVYDETTFYNQYLSLDKPMRYIEGSNHSFDDVKNLLKRNNANVFDTYDDLVDYLNKYKDYLEDMEYQEAMAYTE